jgi:choline-sulfatase
MILRMPDVPRRVDSALHYQIDVAATLADLVAVPLPFGDYWDSVSFADAVRAGRDDGREHLVMSQGASSCQRGVRFDDHLYLRTWHDGYHWWPDQLLLDFVTDPHGQIDLVAAKFERAARGAHLLDEWFDEQIEGAPDRIDPLTLVFEDSGPHHTRGRLPEYLERLRATGRAGWAEDLEQRYAAESSA